MKKSVKAMLALFAALVMVVTMSASVFADGVIGSDAALKKALKNAGLKKSQVTVKDNDYDDEDNTYDIEFVRKSNKKKYSYELSASSGKILEKTIEVRYKRNSSKKEIGKTAALKKVAKSSGISYKIVKKGSCSYDYDDGEGIYEVKFRKGKYRYEYDVLAPNGKIVEYGWEFVG